MSISNEGMIEMIREQMAGKAIQVRRQGSSDTWVTRSERGGFNFIDYEYRVKPGPPKPREGYVWTEVIYDKRPFPGEDYIYVREVLP